MLWIKALHIIFIVTWFAGLFYLPRLFVYHADQFDEATSKRFQIMEWRLFVIMTIGAVLASLFGLWLLFAWHWPLSANTLWLPIKLALVAALIAYHGYCLVLIRHFRAGLNRRSPRWYRWYNEVPSLLLIAIVLLAVVKPF